MKIFFKTLATILIPFLVVFFISYMLMKSNMDSSLQNYVRADTKSKFELIAHDFDTKNINKKKLYAVYAKTYKKTLLRITLIQPNGKVIFDSSIPYAAIEKLENHKYRPEIQKAFKKGSGFSQRFSKTKKMYMLYYAKILPDGNILRISYPLTYLKDIRNHFESGIYTVFLSTLIMLIIVAALMARRLSFPVNKLNYIADAIKNGKNIHFPRFKDKAFAEVSGLIYNIYKAMKQNQKETEIEREKLNHILECMEEGVLLTSEDHRYIHSNARFFDMFNIKFEKDEKILAGIDDAELLSVFSSILSKKTTSAVKIKNKNYKVYCKKMHGHILFVFSDIEDKMQYEYFKSELVGNISHELKTPIAAIMGYAETLVINKDLDEQTKEEFTDKIYESSIRLNNLLNDILELHRLENSNLTSADIVSASDIQKELKNIYKNSTKNIIFDFETGEVKISAEHLLSILRNLIDNALKYSSGKNIYVSLKKENEKIKIIVDDEGPIIPKEDRDRIFERFYTRSKSRNKQKSGTGLGLSIVKHIVKLYNGSVKLKQNEYGGNSFIVEI